MLTPHNVLNALGWILLFYTQSLSASISDTLVEPINNLDQPNIKYEFVDPIAYTSRSFLSDREGNRKDVFDYKVRAVRGEYEPIGLLISSDMDVQLSIETSDLHNSIRENFSSNNIDIKVATKWYQSSDRTVNPHSKGKRFLLRELLLNDESLIKIDRKTKTNYLKINDGTYINISDSTSKVPNGSTVMDSDQLKTIKIKKGKRKLLWITYKIPKNQKKGVYKGHLKITNNKSISTDVPISLEILKFDLKPASLLFGLYYRARLSYREHTHLGSNTKSIHQYSIELENMREHGVLYPTLYEQMPSGKRGKVPLALRLRDKARLPKDKIFIVGHITQTNNSSSYLSRLKDITNKWKTMTASYGYRDFYLYGKDEAKKSEMVKQLPAWRVVQSVGGKIFAACHIGAIDYVGSFLDQPILAAKNNFGEVQKWKNIGITPYVYSNPQVGIEDPELYRHNYGFKLWLSPYGGVMNYAYQHAANDIWNDFDHERYRDHVFAYPATNGVIDTVQWEGFREASDDIRYIDKLAEIIGKRKAEIFLNNTFSKERSSHTIRNFVIDKILSELPEQ